MNLVTWWIAAGIMGIVAAICAMVAGCLDYLQEYHEDSPAATRAWFVNAWAAIDHSCWLAMPERIICGILDVASWRGHKHAYQRVDQLPWFSSAAIVFIIGLASGWKIWGSFHMGVFFGIALVAPNIIIAPLVERLFSNNENFFLAGLTYAFIIVMFGGRVRAIWLALVHSIGVLGKESILLGFVSVFLFGLGLSVVIVAGIGLIYSGFAVLRKGSGGYTHAAILTIAVVLSIAATGIAVFVGWLVDPGWDPQSFTVPRSLFLSNLLFDVLTIQVTLKLLSVAVARPGLARVPSAVISSLLLSAVFAFCSLYFGFLFSSRTLSPRVILHIFVGRSPDGGGWELGPCFWIMHTTFLPVLAYMGVVFLCWEIKGVLIPVRVFLARARSHHKPLGFTATLFKTLASLLTVLSLAAGLVPGYYEKLERLKPRIDPPASQHVTEHQLPDRRP
jgi:hypothetical protein